MTTHRSATSGSKQHHGNQKSPEFQFRGCWVPPIVLEHLRGGRISATDFTLLFLIDAFSGPKGEGCFATNKYLSEQVGVCDRVVRRSIEKLRRLRLLNVNYEAGRNMRTIWSYVTDGTEQVSGGLSKSRGGGLTESTRSEDKEEEKLNTVPRPLRGPRDVDVTETNPMLDGDDVLIDMGVQDKPRTTPTTDDYAFARRLRDVVEQSPYTAPPWSHRAWANQFRLLRESMKGDTARIKEVVDWYCANLGQQMTPLALSGESFRRKFGNIEAARIRDQARRPTVQVSIKAKKLADRLLGRGWPKGSEEYLPAVVQLSLDAVVAFRDRLYKFSPTDPADRPTRLQRFASHLLNATDVADPIHLVTVYMEQLAERLNRWKDWSGSLGDFAWKPGSKEFRSQGREWATGWTDDPDLWDQLLEAIKC